MSMVSELVETFRGILNAYPELDSLSAYVRAEDGELLKLQLSRGGLVGLERDDGTLLVVPEDEL